MSSRCSRSSVVTLSFSRRCVVDAWYTSLRAIVTGCDEVGIVLEEHRRRHHLGDAGDRPLILRVLFPEHLVGFGVVDDGGGGAKIRHEVAARVDLVARDRGVGHLARRRDGARARRRSLAGDRSVGLSSYGIAPARAVSHSQQSDQDWTSYANRELSRTDDEDRLRAQCTDPDRCCPLTAHGGCVLLGNRAVSDRGEQRHSSRELIDCKQLMALAATIHLRSFACLPRLPVPQYAPGRPATSLPCSSRYRRMHARRQRGICHDRPRTRGIPGAARHHPRARHRARLDFRHRAWHLGRPGHGHGLRWPRCRRRRSCHCWCWPASSKRCSRSTPASSASAATSRCSTKANPATRRTGNTRRWRSAGLSRRRPRSAVCALLLDRDGLQLHPGAGRRRRAHRVDRGSGWPTFCLHRPRRALPSGTRRISARRISITFSKLKNDSGYRASAIVSSTRSASPSTNRCCRTIRSARARSSTGRRRRS